MKIGLWVAVTGLIAWVVLTMMGFQFIVCPFKRLTGVPCPACGTTRTLEALLHGDLTHAMTLNPINLFFCLAIAILVFVLMIKNSGMSISFHQDLKRLESFLRKPTIYIPLIAVVLFNWVNVWMKGL